MSEQKLTWKCQTCTFAIGDGDGYIHIEPHLAIERVVETRDWLAARTDEDGVRSIRIGEIGQMPADVRWLIQHSACDPRPDGPGYWIDVERIRTMDELAWWTLHLFEKSWVQPATDWSELAGAAIDRWRAERTAA